MSQGSLFVNLNTLDPKDPSQQKIANRVAKLIHIASWVEQMQFKVTVFAEGREPTVESGRCGNVLAARDIARLLISNDARNGKLAHLLAGEE